MRYVRVLAQPIYCVTCRRNARYLFHWYRRHEVCSRIRSRAADFPIQKEEA